MCGGSSQFFRLVLERNRERTKSWWTNCFKVVKRVYYTNYYYIYHNSTERGNALGLESYLINTLLVTESPSMFSHPWGRVVDGTGNRNNRVTMKLPLACSPGANRYNPGSSVRSCLQSSHGKGKENHLQVLSFQSYNILVGTLISAQW